MHSGSVLHPRSLVGAVEGVVAEFFAAGTDWGEATTANITALSFSL